MSSRVPTPAYHLNRTTPTPVSDHALRRQMTRHRFWLQLVCLLVLGLPFTAMGQDMRIRSAFIEPSNGVLLLTSQVHFDLPTGAQQAIREGVELTLTLDIRINRARGFWFDEEVADLRQRYQLLYHAVSDRYVVRNLNSGEQDSYPTLDAALESLSHIQRLPILDRALIRPNGRYEVSVEAELDVHTMPDALRFILFWADDWRQSSERYTWPLRL